ncbi:ATP-binding protein [Lewinella sp. LCG006]|uniref:PAS domain-containing sensor histidine kinase n=1 Tax=Lewinella sp. LCG006 TaxID=3231911 RepID=UPI003460D491
MKELDAKLLATLPDTERLKVEAYIATLKGKIDYQAEKLEELKTSEVLYREFIELAPVGICRVDLQGHVVYTTAASDQIMGFERNAYINKPLIDLVYSEDKLHFEKLVERLVTEKKQIVHGEFRWVRNDGTVIWLKGSGQLKLDEENRPLYFILSYLDITKNRETERLLREQGALYQAIIKNAAEGIDIIDVSEFHPITNPRGTVLIRNKRMSTLFQSETDLFGTAEEILRITPEVQPNGEPSLVLWERIIKRLYKMRASQEVFRFWHSEELYFDIEAFEQVLEIDGRKLLLRIYHDITERVKQENLIEEQLEQLNTQNKDLQTYIESNMQLENFAYIASHDLRAPIRNIVSFSNLLERRLVDRLDEKEQEFLQFIINSAVNMQALIEDLLTFSRANTNKRQLSLIPFPLLIDELEQELQPIIENKKAVVVWPEESFSIYADRIKLKQLLQNLIENGLKFCLPEQQPEVVLTVTNSPEEWQFSVKDNGIGIEEEFLSNIFLIFKRLHSQKEYEGTGIGLALCKKLVEQHEGRIWVHSTPGKGSTFYFTVPKGLAD